MNGEDVIRAIGSFSLGGENKEQEGDSSATCDKEKKRELSRAFSRSRLVDGVDVYHFIDPNHHHHRGHSHSRLFVRAWYLINSINEQHAIRVLPHVPKYG